MFDSNVTLLKIIWRLESRQSFRLNKMIVRNNDIDRRIQAIRLALAYATASCQQHEHAVLARSQPSH